MSSTSSASAEKIKRFVLPFDKQHAAQYRERLLHSIPESTQFVLIGEASHGELYIFVYLKVQGDPGLVFHRRFSDWVAHCLVVAYRMDMAPSLIELQ